MSRPVGRATFYRKKENLSQLINEKVKNRKKKSQSICVPKKLSPDKNNKYSINLLYRKRINSIEKRNCSIVNNKNINLEKSLVIKNNNFYDSLISLLPFYELNYYDLKYNLNNIIYYSEDSTLYKGKYLHNDICIKEINNINYMEKIEIERIKNEIEISIKLRHKNIINTLGYSFNQNKTKFYIITDYMKNKSLKYYIEANKGKISLKQKLTFIYEIALAIEYMHSRKEKIFHRDIKSSNILLDDELHCKLCDFGMSKIYQKENDKEIKKEESNSSNNNNLNTNYQTNSQSTLFWMSPEYLCDGIINEKSDIYSFGILIWEIFMEDTNPYKNININDYLLGNKEIIYNKRPIINDNYFKECPKIKEIMTTMWDNDYNKRPDIGYILNFFNSLNEEFLFL